MCARSAGVVCMMEAVEIDRLTSYLYRICGQLRYTYNLNQQRKLNSH